jgi:hypothetical protein
MVVGIALGITFGAVMAYSVLAQAREAYRNERVAPAKSSPVQSQPATPNQKLLATLAEPAERIFVPIEVDAAFLQRLYKTNTKVQADRLMQSYIGKWMRFSGTVSDVTTDEGYKYPIAAMVLDDRSGTYMHLDFTTEWRERVSMLPKDSRVRAIGRINTQNTMNECELLDED